MTVMLKHSKDGRIALAPITEDSSKIERYTHVLEELVIRGIDYRQPEIIAAMQAPKPNSPKVRRALRILSRNDWPEPMFVKFGERKHMTALLLEGKGRISLGRTYNDPTLGQARADDESQISVYVHPADAHRLMAVEHDENGSRGLNVDEPVRVNKNETHGVKV